MGILRGISKLIEKVGGEGKVDNIVSGVRDKLDDFLTRGGDDASKFGKVDQPPGTSPVTDPAQFSRNVDEFLGRGGGATARQSDNAAAATGRTADDAAAPAVGGGSGGGGGFLGGLRDKLGNIPVVGGPLQSMANGGGNLLKWGAIGTAGVSFTEVTGITDLGIWDRINRWMKRGKLADEEVKFRDSTVGKVDERFFNENSETGSQQNGMTATGLTQDQVLTETNSITNGAQVMDVGQVMVNNFNSDSRPDLTEEQGSVITKSWNTAVMGADFSQDGVISTKREFDAFKDSVGDVFEAAIDNSGQFDEEQLEAVTESLDSMMDQFELRL